MHWIAILGIVVVVIALATLFRVRPEGGRPAGKTKLMGVARIIAILIGVLLVLAALSGG